MHEFTQMVHYFAIESNREDGERMNGIQISPKEKELGLKFKCFEGGSFDEAIKTKNKWFTKNKGLKVVKLKTSVNRGRGRVVGKWSSFKIYVSYIEVDKFESLKEYRRKRHEKHLLKKATPPASNESQK